MLKVKTEGPGVSQTRLDEIEAMKPVVARQSAPGVYVYVVEEKDEPGQPEPRRDA